MMETRQFYMVTVLGWLSDLKWGIKKSWLESPAKHVALTFIFTRILISSFSITWLGRCSEKSTYFLHQKEASLMNIGNSPKHAGSKKTSQHRKGGRHVMPAMIYEQKSNPSPRSFAFQDMMFWWSPCGKKNRCLTLKHTTQLSCHKPQFDGYNSQKDWNVAILTTFILSKMQLEKTNVLSTHQPPKLKHQEFTKKKRKLTSKY